MQNTIKIPTVAWAIAALLFLPLFTPTSSNLSTFTVRLVGAAAFAYLAYKTFRSGFPADASTEVRAAAKQRAIGQAFTAVVLLAVGVIMATSIGMIRLPDVGSISPFSPSIEGKYRDPNGSTLEFLGDGTVLVVIRGKQAVWTWTIYDVGRLKLEPDPGLIGVSAAMCDYQLTANTLRVTGCEYAMQLTRL